MISTNLEQSKHLLELGLDPNTADMVWIQYDKDNEFLLEVEPSREECWDLEPSWSLPALLKAMPCSAFISVELIQDSFGYWACEFKYEHDKVITHRTIGSDHKGHPCPVAAAYGMVCWLLEQGLIKKGGKK